MITAVFSRRNGIPCGFDICGHSNTAPAGEDIVCSAVSSAVYMAANTIVSSDASVDASASDGVFRLYAADADAFTVRILNGLACHLQGIGEQYPGTVRVIYLNLNGGNN